MKKSKVLISSVPKKFSSCQMNLFKVSTMSAKVRAFQHTNSCAHATHTDKMVQGKLYQVRFLGIHNIKTVFLKLKACQWLFKNLGNYIDTSYVGPEQGVLSPIKTHFVVSDETKQM